MRLNVTQISDGPGPGEVVVGINTAAGRQEQVVVHSAGVMDDTIEVGYPLARTKDRSLIELPRESMSGKWRLWVPQAAMIE